MKLKLYSYEQDSSDLFMKKILAKEEILSTLLESKYAKVLKLNLAHKICVSLHKKIEGDFMLKRLDCRV